VRILLLSWKTWGVVSYAEQLGPEFDVLSIATDFTTYDDLVRQYPPGWRPESIVCWSIDYMPVPEGIEEAGCFTVGVIGDWNMAAQSLHCTGDAFDLLLTDRGGCDMLAKAGFKNFRQILFAGYLPTLFRRLPDVERDIDILFVGNFNQGVQAHRARWLARVAQLSGRYRVLLATNVFGEELIALMNRARVVFNRSIRGELNQRAYEAPACGALMFLERENLEVADVFTDRRDCVLYGEDDLEDLLAYYLEHEVERAEVAEAGYRVVQDHTAEDCLRRVMRIVRDAKAEIGLTERPLRSVAAVDLDVQRAWQWLRASTSSSVKAAAAALTRAEAAGPRPDVCNAAGCLLSLTAISRRADAPDLAIAASDRAASYEQQALELFPDYAAALYNLANIFYERGDLPGAEVHFRRARSILSSGGLGVEHVFGPYYRTPVWTTFDMEMERAWNLHAFGSDGWIEAVRTALLWHTQLMLNDIALGARRYSEAALDAQGAIEVLPDSPIAHSRLAVALLRQGDRPLSAEAFLRALELAPLVEWTWLEALPLLRDIGHPRYEEQLRIGLNLARACPSLLHLRRWMAGQAPELWPGGDEDPPA